ncbi:MULTISPECIES: ABC transporter substrate-binding protein [Sphaerochaeta]|uniref:ABC transporter substrate-binding protein n=1 Tax=Sphaerochaeta TaxID=399320 RepID=UPI00258F1803|nr:MULTISPECIES: ABC transporter substrate-binding protein [Sphaerochaeta]MDD3423805.1 ABC transporter substrate-binding protein [Sphaerochaeta sp.]MDD3455910.1 ABC transporter substrate-binding protein [Sphaerochaeta sp.]MDD4038205.1 ABC transporter substrate-binding protein [Sphaerochaeta sp.]MDD4450199.1 ABC transporter substrate-binding protein [Sphaerochaeta sp.]MEA5028288.1 ABC transporter substrate-binding protein [Sphaerochaeta associata]
MRKHLLNMVAFSLMLVLAAGTVFGAGTQEAAKETTVNMFQLKVEIKDAIDGYAAAYSAATPGVTVKVETLGGGADYGGALKAKAQAGQMPDIFVIEGRGGYDIWKDYIADLGDQAWVADTDLAFKVDGKVYGFPVAIEGYGLAYNADILAKAGIDPAKLTTRAAYEQAFKTLEAKKAELGIDAPVSMAASVAGGMWWVAAQHNLATYWGGGLDFTDTRIIDMALQGKLDDARFLQYAKYLQLLFKYADQKILLNGSYDDQVGAFAQGKTAFLHQGNWVDPNLAQLGVTFPIGYAPHAFLDTEQKGLYLFAPSWYCVNAKSPNAEAAKAFLNAMATTAEGHDYMVNKAGMIPAFKSVTLKPAGQLSQALMAANAKGGNYGVFFGMLPDGAGQNVFGPIFDLFAQNQNNINQFIADMKKAVADLPKM